MSEVLEASPAAVPAGRAGGAGGAGGILRRPLRGTTVGLITIITLVAFEAMAVATAMPTAVRELRGLAFYGWAFTAFLMANIVGMVSSGAMADRYGPARPLLTGLAVFGTGLLLAGAAPTMGLFVAGRAVQGFGSGLQIVAVYVVIGAVYADDQRLKVFAALAGAWVLPALVGPVLAGALAQHLSWRWVFLGLVPVLAGSAALLVPGLRRLPGRSPRRSPRRSGAAAGPPAPVDLAAALPAQPVGGLPAQPVLPARPVGDVAAQPGSPAQPVGDLAAQEGRAVLPAQRVPVDLPAQPGSPERPDRDLAAHAVLPARPVADVAAQAVTPAQPARVDLPAQAGGAGGGGSEPAAGGQRASTGARWWAAVAAAAGIAAVQASGQRPGWASLALALPGLGALALGLRRLVPRGTIVLRAGVPAVVALRGALAGSLFAVEALVPLTLTLVHGYSPTAAGVPLMVAAVTWSVLSWWQGRRPELARHRLIGCGFGLIAVGAVGMAVVTQPATPGWLAYPVWGVAGAGAGLVWASLSVQLLALSPPARHGTDSAALQICDAVGSSLCIGFGGALVAAAERGTLALPTALLTVDLLMAVLAAGAAVLAGRVRAAG